MNDRTPSNADDVRAEGGRLAEETLDPEDWEELRALGHRMVDDVIAYHANIGAGPAWRPVPEAVRRALQEELPADPVGVTPAYDQFRAWILPYAYGNVHPRGWGWVNGTGTTLGAFAEMLAAAMNSNCWGGNHAGPLVEAQVLDWLKQLLGYPRTASGLLVSGGSVANLVGLAAARDAVGGPEIAQRGLQALSAELVVYASEEVHNSIDRAVALLGIGTQGLRRIATGTDYRMDLQLLAESIAADRAAGRRPICVVGTAGTVNTGAIDDLQGIAELCARERLWFHVDGAFGALAALSPELRPLVVGMERADSLAFDLHKWLFIPIEAGCVLVRDPADHLRPFAPSASYLARFDRGIASGSHSFSLLGPQLTRGFRALKVWFSLRAHGAAVYGRLVGQNVRQARALAALIAASPDLQLAAPVPLNVVCFRYAPPQLPDAQLDDINRETLLRLQESGEAAVSSTVLRGRFVLRAALTNHRTRNSDLHRLVAAVRTLAAQVQREGD